jgi:hypothetical protein
MSFRDGPDVDVETNLWDQLNAEKTLGGDITKSAAEMGARVWWQALRRTHPEHPAAKSFRDFVDNCVGVTDEEERAVAAGAEPGPNGLDPTRWADSDA